MTSDHTETYNNLLRWHKGDEAALDALLGCHLSWIKTHVRQRLGKGLRRRVESSDIVQDAILQFLRYGPRILLSSEKQFRTLMARIVENVLRDKHDWFTAYRRAVSKERPLPSETVLYLEHGIGNEKTPSISAQRHEEEEWLRLGMELLDPDDQELLVLYQWEHLTFEEIGKRLGLATDVAWKRHQRAFIRLAELVGDMRRGDFSFLNKEDSDS
jgi:RNA polymerase sigma-70 factor (ECF subfamily)